MMAQCKPLEVDSIIPSKRRLSVAKWQRTWCTQFKNEIPSANNLQAFCHTFFADQPLDISIKIKSLKVATFIFDFESMEQEVELELIFDFLMALDKKFLSIERVEDRLFNQWDFTLLSNKI